MGGARRGPGLPGRGHGVPPLSRLPRAITSSTYTYALSELEPVAEWASEVVNSLPPTVELTLLVAPAPSEVEPGPEGRVLIVAATAFEDSAEEAAAALAPLEGSPVLDRALTRQVNEPSPFDVLFRDFGGLWREGRRYASDNSGRMPTSPTSCRACARTWARRRAPSRSRSQWWRPKPAEDAPEEELPDMAFSMVGRAFVSCYAMWEDEADDAGATENAGSPRSWPTSSHSRSATTWPRPT